MIIFRLYFLFSILIAEISFAAMPPISMILDRTVENNPINIQYNQILQFQKSNIETKEIWTVLNSKKMHLKAEVTIDSKKYFLEKNYSANASEEVSGMQKTNKTIPTLFFENLNFVKNREEFQRLLIEKSVATNEDFNQKYSQKNEEDFDYFPHVSMVLSRFDGTVNYLLYKGNYPQNIDHGLWIEQDAFVIKKIKFNNEANLIFKNYVSFGKNNMFPKEKIFEMTTENILMKTGSLNQIKMTALPALQNSNFNEIPETEKTKSMLEFYRRYR